ncbi:MAG: 3D-(3,5/4)-trihydroxycyclohexane-1,2-dione acylhydrolase (decyclizing) [Steroidobacteraceae bacterium]
MSSVRVTAAQAVVDYLANQYVADTAGESRYFAGVWAIFGHGNVAGLGEALHGARELLPTYRAHNEQAMAHAAIAYAKQRRRRHAMICTSSIGPGATNMVTAAALAHVNRLPVLFLPGDVFASRTPDPVLQQIENFSDGTVSANDCFRPVSRYFDRITRPEQILEALPRAMATLLDPAACGPVTLAFCQDVQAEAYDFPQAFFRRQLWTVRAQPPDPREVEELVRMIKAARSPLLICGGGVLYSEAEAALAAFAESSDIPVAETQGGKGALSWNHPCLLGSIGVTGSSAANAAAAAADLIVAIGTRLQDFTTGSRALFRAPGHRLVQINVAAYDAAKHGAMAVVGDAGAVLKTLRERLSGWHVPGGVRTRGAAVAAWNSAWEQATSPPQNGLPSDAQVIGAVWRRASENAVVVCAAGGLPGELHKLWRCRRAGGYHVEYGYSCMGYEIAGGLGVKMAEPDREVHVLLGDGSYLMLNSELATSVMLGQKLIVTVLDNRGFGCINRLQRASGSAAFHTLWADSPHETALQIDFAAHAASLGALAEKVATIAELEQALERAKSSTRTHVIVLDTDPAAATLAGGAWWDVAIPEVSARPEVRAARAAYVDYLDQRTRQGSDS